MTKRRTLVATGVATGVALAATAGIAPATADGGHTSGEPVARVIATGLDNPRQLSCDHGQL